MTANETRRDDLTAISGIGPVRQQWLREELGVDTYQDLAAFTVDELEEQMREAGKSVSRSDIEHWLREAQRLSGSEASSEDANSPEEKWKPFASFVVEYQEREAGEERRTTVHHMEKDKDADWLGIVRAELCQWMLEQAGESVPDLEALEKEIRDDAQERLQEELAARETEARRRLEKALAEERAAAERALEEEMARRRKAAVSALEQETEERRTALREEIEREIEEERAAAKQALEEEMARRREAAVQALEQATEERRTGLREEIERDIEEERAAAERALEEELARRRTEAVSALEQELDRRREEEVRKVEADLEEERTQARQELERDLAARRAASILELEQEVEERRAEEAVEEAVEAPSREPSLLEEAVETVEEAVAQPAPEAVDEAIRFALTEIRGYQPPYVGEPRSIEENDVAPAPLRHDYPFAIVILFRLAEADANALAAMGATYTAQIFARDLSTGKTQQLGRTAPSRFVEGRTSYTDTLSNVELAAGVYRLTVFVTCETTPPGLGSRVVPMLLIA